MLVHTSHERINHETIHAVIEKVIDLLKTYCGIEAHDDARRRREKALGKVLSLDEQAEVPFGHFTDVLLTKDYTPIEPEVLEYKLYAPGVGQVLAQTVSGGSEREELISFTK